MPPRLRRSVSLAAGNQPEWLLCEGAGSQLRRRHAAILERFAALLAAIQGECGLCVKSAAMGGVGAAPESLLLKVVGN